MTIYNALKKIDSLSESELKHCIQRMTTDIENYIPSLDNYPAYRLEKYGLPYLRKLEGERQRFIDRLNSL